MPRPAGLSPRRHALFALITLIVVLSLVDVSPARAQGRPIPPADPACAPVRPEGEIRIAPGETGGWCSDLRPAVPELARATVTNDTDGTITATRLGTGLTVSAFGLIPGVRGDEADRYGCGVLPPGNTTLRCTAVTLDPPSSLHVVAVRAPFDRQPILPENFRASWVGIDAVDLLWVNGTSLTALYRLAIWQYGQSAKWEYRSLPPETDFLQLIGLEPGAAYAFRLMACNGLACSPWSPQLEVKLRPPPPAMPESLRVGWLGATALDLLWNDTIVDEGYVEVAWWRQGWSAGWTTVTVAPRAGWWQHTALAPDTPYVYMLRACNAAGCSDWTEQLEIMTLPAGTAP